MAAPDTETQKLAAALDKLAPVMENVVKKIDERRQSGAPNIGGGAGLEALGGAIGSAAGKILELVAASQQWVQLLNPGLMEQFNVALNNLHATFGTAFTGIFSEAIGFFRNIAGAVAPLFAQLAPIVDQLAGVFFRELAVSIGSFLPVIEALIPVVAALAAVISVLQDVFRPFISITALLGQVLAELASFIITGIVNVLAPFFATFSAVMQGVSNVFRTVGVVLAAFFEVLQSVFQIAVGWNLDDLVKQTTDAFKELIKSITITAVKIAYLIDQALGDKVRDAILRRLAPGPGATAAGQTAIKNLEQIGKDFALAAVNAAKGGGASEETWRKEVADLLKDIRDNTKSVGTEAREKAREFVDDVGDAITLKKARDEIGDRAGRFWRNLTR